MSKNSGISVAIVTKATLFCTPVKNMAGNFPNFQTFKLKNSKEIQKLRYQEK